MVANDPPSPTRTIAGRYLLGSRLGSGLEAAVFEAFDEQLQRTVVVKLVHPDLSDLPQVRDDFYRIMPTAESLRHPNVAAVMDFGAARWNDRDVLFVVGERFTGGSLRDILDRGRLLSPSQALVVGLDACKALDAVHRQGLVHSDVRPSTLVFGDDHRLRIVEVGLAQVLHDSAGDVTGRSIDRAKYSSPEEALARPLQPKSDVYSLCLSVLEAVTGVVPFVGDSTVATLANRVDKLMPVSADLGPLAAVFERAGRPVADDRYSAAEFGRALVAAAEKLPRPAPLPILTTSLFAPERVVPGQPVDPTGPLRRPSAVESDVESDAEHRIVDDSSSDEDPTLDMDVDDEFLDDAPADDVISDDLISDDVIEDEIVVDEPTAAIAIEDLPSTTAVPVVPPPPPPLPPPVVAPVAEAPTAAMPTIVSATEHLDESPVATGVAGLDDEYDPDDEFPERPPMRSGGRWWVLALLLVIAVGGGVLAWYTSQPESSEVPDVSGQRQGAAINELGDFDWTVAEESSETVAAGDVIRTDPAAGTKLEDGSDITLFVSTGPAPRPLPELIGLTVSQARSELEELGLVLTEGAPVFNEDVPVGEVLSWVVPAAPTLTAGATVTKGTTVQVVASAGPQPRTVPDLASDVLAAATTELEGLGLVIAQQPDEFSNTVPAGSIIRQSPAPGATVDRGATITVVVSKGQDLVALPSMRSFNLQQATAALTTAGFAIGTVQGDGNQAIVSASVNGALAVPGQQFVRGTRVDLVFQPTPPPTSAPAP